MPIFLIKINRVKTSFENIYNAYCPMLYSIALQLCPTRKIAEKILLNAFKKVYQQNIVLQEKKPFCIDLIKIIIQTAQEELYPGETKCNFKIKQFEKTPLLHKLLIEQHSLENYCNENGITRHNALLIIRNEFMFIRNTCAKNLLDAPELSSFQLN